MCVAEVVSLEQMKSNRGMCLLLQNVQEQCLTMSAGACVSFLQACVQAIVPL